MNLKVPGAILPLVCVLLSTGAKTVSNPQTPFGELGLNVTVGSGKAKMGNKGSVPPNAHNALDCCPSLRCTIPRNKVHEHISYKLKLMRYYNNNNNTLYYSAIH